MPVEKECCTNYTVKIWTPEILQRTAARVSRATSRYKVSSPLTTQRFEYDPEFICDICHGKFKFGRLVLVYGEDPLSLNEKLPTFHVSCILNAIKQKKEKRNV